MEDNKMGQLGFKIDTGELATSTIPEDFTAPEEYSSISRTDFFSR